MGSIPIHLASRLYGVHKCIYMQTYVEDQESFQKSFFRRHPPYLLGYIGFPDGQPSKGATWPEKLRSPPVWLPRLQHCVPLSLINFGFGVLCCLFAWRCATVMSFKPVCAQSETWYQKTKSSKQANKKIQNKEYWENQ